MGAAVLVLPVQNPFGDAKPREAVLASRTGKSENEILAEEVKSEKPKVGAAMSCSCCGPLGMLLDHSGA